ncbi:hypothetical protein P7K49_029980 [Saguinus oedipus]|uniref:Uncharacterized protein n=1 Tax=Saguinus oedipus TaxID=9490 RepID=A0ABQ9U8W7_SAGOE|nr:hypothetical protein P7K49_029980 [Saguinus oedipus]
MSVEGTRAAPASPSGALNAPSKGSLKELPLRILQTITPEFQEHCSFPDELPFIFFKLEVAPTGIGGLAVVSVSLLAGQRHLRGWCSHPGPGPGRALLSSPLKLTEVGLLPLVTPCPSSRRALLSSPLKLREVGPLPLVTPCPGSRRALLSSPLKLREANPLLSPRHGASWTALFLPRWNAFEVLALDGVSSGILQFYTAQDGADWLRAVSANIRELMLQNVSTVFLSLCQCSFVHEK